METFHRGIPDGAEPTGIASDGHALWFTEAGDDRIGRITPGGHVRQFRGLSHGAAPTQIARGADGAMWFLEPGLNRIGRITATGGIREFGAGIPPNSDLEGIAAGPGGMWFTEYQPGRVARIDRNGRVTTMADLPNEFPLPIARGRDGAMWIGLDVSGPLLRIDRRGHRRTYTGPESAALALTPGPKAAIWFAGLTEVGVDRLGVGRVTAAGRLVLPGRHLDPAPEEPAAIAAGPDGNLWFTDLATDQVARMTPGGAARAFGPGIGGESGPGLHAITAGPDSAMWFTESGYDQIGRITTTRRDCVVPSLTRLRLGLARVKLARAGCRVGRTPGAGRFVATQRPGVGRVLRYRARVGLRLVRHRPRRPRPPPYDPCAAPRGAKVIAKTATAVAYERLRKFTTGGEQHAEWWACRLGVGPLRLLLRVDVGDVYDDVAIDDVVVAGDLVGFEKSDIDHYGDGSWQAIVRDLRTGRDLSSFSTGSAVGDGGTSAIPSALALDDAGDVAWIETLEPSQTAELHLHHAGRESVLDTGPRGSIAHVALTDTTLTWTHSGAARSYALP